MYLFGFGYLTKCEKNAELYYRSSKNSYIEAKFSLAELLQLSNKNTTTKFIINLYTAVS